MKQYVITALILLGGAAGLTLRYFETVPENGPDFAQLPYEFAEYNGIESRFDESTYQVLKADTTTLRRYQGADGTVYWLFVAYFKDQKYGSQIHSPRHCLPGGGWRIEELSEMTIDDPINDTRDINRLEIAWENQRQVMLYWFESRSGIISDEFALKFDLVKNSLLFRPTDAAFVRLTVQRPDANSDKAAEQGAEFFKALDQALLAALPFRS